MKIRLDIERLKEIEEITSPLRKKRGGWKSKGTIIRNRKTLERAFIEYSNFWIRIVAGLFPKFDHKKHLIRMTAIEVSPEVDVIIGNILYGFSFVVHSPVRNPALKGNECIIHVDKALVQRGDDHDRKF